MHHAWLVVAAMVPSLIACLAFYIALSQRTIAANKYRMDLFSIRFSQFKLFEAAYEKAVTKKLSEETSDYWHELAALEFQASYLFDSIPRSHAKTKIEEFLTVFLALKDTSRELKKKMDIVKTAEAQIAGRASNSPEEDRQRQSNLHNKKIEVIQTEKEVGLIEKDVKELRTYIYNRFTESLYTMQQHTRVPQHPFSRLKK